MKRLFLITLLFFPALCFSQQNFKPGYIIDLKGDTLKGQVDYREWQNNPSDFRFRLTATGVVDTYSINNTRGFGIDGFESYEAFTVSISQDDIALSDLDTDTTRRIENVFLKVLVKGDKVNLYSYSDKIKNRFYFAETGSAPRELGYWVDHSTQGLTFKRAYRNQLIYLAQKYQPELNSLLNSISRAEYNESALTAIALKINGLAGGKTVSYHVKSTFVYLGAGLGYNLLKFTGNTHLASNAANTITPLPYVNVGLLSYVNPGTRKLYFAVDVTLKGAIQKTKSTVTSSNNSATNFIEYSNLDYRQYTASLSPQIGCNFYNTEALKVFGNVGFGINFSVYKSTVISGYESYSTVVTEPNYPEFKSIWINPQVKAGVTLNQKFSIYAAYNMPAAITTYAYFQGNIGGYQLGFNFLLGK